MRIAWDCRSISPHMGGIGHATAGWLREFLQQKPHHWSTVAIFSSRCKTDYLLNTLPEIRNNAEVVLVDAGMVDTTFEQLYLPVLLQKQKVDLYFNTCFSIPAVKTTRLQASIVHDIVFFEKPNFVEENLRKYLAHGTDLALHRADMVFTVSEYSLRRIQELGQEKGWSLNQIRAIIRPGISESFSELLGLWLKSAQNNKSPRGSGEFILYLGSIEEKKGIVVLLDAYAILRNRIGNRCPTLVLAGGIGGKSFDLKSGVQSRGLNPFVQQLGHVTEQQKVELLCSAAVFVFPSYYEGFGIPPLEAMACGTPVIAARATSVPEILGDAAVYFTPGAPDELAATIDDVLGDAELRARLKDRGKFQAGRYRFKDEVGRLINEFKKAATAIGLT